MLELIEWVRDNCRIDYENEVVIIGEYYNKAFRIHLKGEYAEIAKLVNHKTDWNGRIYAKDLQSFKTYLHCN